jgi:NAD(P)-dependent dehydrogenase (short-subunit alcohol dehydrogenase family)
MTANRTILISGASRGLGAATARAAGQMDTNVVLMARSGVELAVVEEEIKDGGGQALAVPGDVSFAADCEQVVAQTVAQFGRLDAVVNNAAVIRPITPIAGMALEEWEQNLATNLTGPFLLTRAALPALRASNGRLINVSAGAAVMILPGWAAYSAAKAALNHFTRILAAEEPEITAIAFRPGAINTPMQATIRNEGAEGMTPDLYDHFCAAFKEDKLLPPEVPGCALAVLALYARREWSGEFMPWNHEELQSLVRRFGCSPNQ